MTSRATSVEQPARRQSETLVGDEAALQCQAADEARPCSRWRKLASAVVAPLVKRAAAAYVAGDALNDALRVQRQLAAARRYASLAYWNRADESPDAVASQYLTAIEALGRNRLGGSVSVKLSALSYRDDLLAAVGAAARDADVPLHCDSLDCDQADRIRAAIEQWHAAGVEVGVTLPGRWPRSRDDASWAADLGLSVRVVKGQWIDPAEPQRDPRLGFLEVVEQLAGRAKFVSLATHDVNLADAAISCLRDAGTRCNQELLYGWPMQGSLLLAKRLQIDLRVYVPYGGSYLPYPLSKLVARPSLLLRFVRDLLRGNAALERLTLAVPE